MTATIDTDLEEQFIDNDVEQGINLGYDNSTFGDDDPDYVAIAVAKNVKNYSDAGDFIASYPSNKTERIESFDPEENYTVGIGTCEILNLCVPAISVPSATLELADSLEYDSDGNLITPEDERLAQEIKDLADTIDDLTDYNIPAYISQDSLDSGFELPDLPHTLDEYNDRLAESTIELTTQDSVSCREETEFVIPDYEDIDLDNNEEIQDILDKLEDLMDEDTSIDTEVSPVDNAKLTDRTVDGQGTFDWLSTALYNQLEKSVNSGLINKSEVRDVYAKGLQTTLQTSASFLIQNEQAYWANLAQKNNMELAKIQAQLTKAELAMLPLKVKLQYTQIEAELKKLEILKYQAQQEKYKIPLIAAQVDQTREQTALVCQQKKQAVEQLAQAELDRQIKQRQIDLAEVQHEEATIKLRITQEQVIQSQQQTKQMVAQTEQTVEQTKLVNAQMQGALKDVKLKDAQLIQMKAQLKLQAQQLLKEKESIALVKAQTASAYANIAMLTEQLKASKAQYSDTIDGEKVGGVIGAQISVNKAQAMGFERDSYYKFYSQVQAGWSAKKTSDIATLSPNAFNALSVDRLTNWYSQKYFNMPNDIFDMPDDYTDYLSDEAMDGTEATPSTASSSVSS